MDDATFVALCEGRAESFYRVAVSILGNRQDAEDAVQQAMMKGWAARARARRGCEAAWLMRIVVNECRNIQRRRMRVSPSACMPEAPFEPPDIALRLALDALPEALRLPLLLKYMEGLSEKEVAEALHLSVTAVKSRLLRARRALQKQLGEEVDYP